MPEYAAIAALKKRIAALENETRPIQDGIVYLLRRERLSLSIEIKGYELLGDLNSGLGKETLKELRTRMEEIEGIIGRMKG
jgi:hypothetical protein